MKKENVDHLLTCIGEDPKREGLVKTPQRFMEAWKYINSGYNQKPEDVVNGALFKAENNNMIVVKDIDFFSTCEHHLLPFFGKIHVGYIPDKKIIGLSKIPRLVDIYSRRLQVQERVCAQVADEIMKVLKPQGVAVVAEGIHTCMVIRGVEKVNSKTVTSAMRGCFLDKASTRSEFLELIK